MKQSKRGEKYIAAKAKINKATTYSIAEAMKLAKETATTTFDSSVELHARLGIDVSKGDQQIRSTVVLPHTKGSTKRVIAFVSDAKEKEAKEAGADIIANEAMIDEIAKTGKIDFDVAIATPDMMAKLAKVARVLGPRGLMPNPKTDTVGPDVKRMVTELKKGKISFKNDNTANVHMVIGKASQSVEELTANYDAALEALRKAKPQTSKGTYIKTMFVTTTMGPSIKVVISG